MPSISRIRVKQRVLEARRGGRDFMKKGEGGGWAFSVGTKTSILIGA